VLNICNFLFFNLDMACSLCTIGKIDMYSTSTFDYVEVGATQNLRHTTYIIPAKQTYLYKETNKHCSFLCVSKLGTW